MRTYATARWTGNGDGEIRFWQAPRNDAELLEAIQWCSLYVNKFVTKVFGLR